MNKINKKVNYIFDSLKSFELIIYSNSDLSFPRHNHTSIFSIIIMFDGQIELITEDKKIICTQFDSVLIKPFQVHKINCIKEYSMLTFCIKKDYLKITKQDVIKQNINNFLMQINELDDLRKQKVLSIIFNFIESKEVKDFKSFTEDNSLAKDLIENSLDAKILITDLANAENKSEFYFIRKFKKMFGLTPHQFLLQKRIRKSQSLLEDKNDFSDIALESGFFDQSHFIKSFKKVMQVTPTEYVLSCKKIQLENNLTTTKQE